MNRNEYQSFSDLLLWDYIRRGDKIAFEQLYRRYYSPLLSYALSFRYDRDKAEDCIQSLFVKLFTSEMLPACRYVHAYLYRSFHHLLSDQSNLSTREVSVEEIEYDALGVEDEDLENLFAEDDESLLKSKKMLDAYARLPINQQNAIYFYYIKEFTYDELSEILEISPHSCMNLVARAVAKMKQLLL